MPKITLHRRPTGLPLFVSKASPAGSFHQESKLAFMGVQHASTKERRLHMCLGRDAFPLVVCRHKPEVRGNREKPSR